MIKFFKKYHKWISIIITLLMVLFVISGIVLNHRQFFSKIGVNRKFLPKEYRYNNWNLAAVKSTERVGNDSILIYGNIGIWLTDSNFANFTDFNQGLPEGIDNRKISKIYKTHSGTLFAGTLFGLYKYDVPDSEWQKIPLALHDPRIVDITEKQDTLIILSRSYLLKSADYRNFTKQILPKPENYDGKVSLFKTLWIIHSGEIYGEIGKLFVDLIGIIFLFLTITGLILFVNKYIIGSKKKRGKQTGKLIKSSRWNLKWHNKIGWTTLVFLIITTITGMFLRPPLLIAIANSKVEKIPFTLLDTDNAWFDKLRRIIYDEKNNRYIIATNGGLYYSNDNFASKIKPFKYQPPLSVMGVNTFKQISDTKLLVGSFVGLFEWDMQTGSITDYITKRPYRTTIKQGSPIGTYLISGYTNDFKGAEIYFDYNLGANCIDRRNRFPTMPNIIENQQMSLWNLMLEVHTARIFEPLIGVFYILIIPLMGILTLFVLISGFIVWYKK